MLLNVNISNSDYAPNSCLLSPTVTHRLSARLHTESMKFYLLTHSITLRKTSSSENCNKIKTQDVIRAMWTCLPPDTKCIFKEYNPMFEEVSRLQPAFAAVSDGPLWNIVKCCKTNCNYRLQFPIAGVCRLPRILTTKT